MMSRVTYTEAGASFQPASDNGRAYRYALWRTWDVDGPRVLWVMLNPSTADGLTDDPTIRRCVGFAANWGYGGIDVANLYALQATDPRVIMRLRRAFVDCVGPENDHHIQAAAERAALIVCAWGAHPTVAPRVHVVYRLLREAAPHTRPSCLRLTMDGSPSHPLFVPRDARPQPYLPRRMAV